MYKFFFFLLLLFLQIPKPVILFLDGHSSHLGLEASKYCWDHQIILYCFLPNAIHILQPFDVGIFSPLKDSSAAAVLSWQICNIGSPITKHYFNIILEMAWRNTTNSEDGKAVQLAARAFRKTGIYPFDSSKVDYLRTLSGKQEQAKSGYFTMMAKQNEKQQDAAVVPITSTRPQQDAAVVPTTSTAPQQDAVVPTTSTAPQQDAVVPTMSTVPQQDAAVVPLGTPQYTTPSSMRPRDEKYVTPHMAKLHVPEQCSWWKLAFVRQILPKGLSGDEAIRIREECLAEKKRLDEEKEKRKLDREGKKKKRIEENERKRVIREQKKAEREAKKKCIEVERANRKGGKRKKSRREASPSVDSSPSEDEVDVNVDDDSDDDAGVIQTDQCYRCTKKFEDDTNGPMVEPVGCDRCPRWFHFGCLPAIIQEQVDDEISISDVFFECDFCWRWRERRDEMRKKRRDEKEEFTLFDV